LIFTGFFISCTQTNTSEQTEAPISFEQPQGIVGLIEGKIFCVPSPYKFAQHIRNVGATFNQSILNPTSNRNLYQSSFKKSINLGIYGIDLAYITTFEQSTDAIQYFSAISTLSNELGLSEIFDIHTIERLENNINSRDSILLILSNKYREADHLLKSENQKGLAVLVLTGSWIESLYLLTQIELERPHPKTREHIAEHMFSANSILGLLKPYYKTNDDFTQLTDAVVAICYEFDGITYNYSYVKPITYPDLKKTVFTSKSSIDIFPEHLESITKKIALLRNSLIK
jgi:hypothetical protein